MKIEILSLSHSFTDLLNVSGAVKDEASQLDFDETDIFHYMFRCFVLHAYTFYFLIDTKTRMMEEQENEPVIILFLNEPTLKKDGE